MTKVHKALKKGAHKAMLDIARLRHIRLWPLRHCSRGHHDWRQLAGIPRSHNKPEGTGHLRLEHAHGNNSS